MHFLASAMRPGKPLAFGAIEGIPFVLACRAIQYPRWFLFEQFRPSLPFKMQGIKKLFARRQKPSALRKFRKSAGLQNILFAP